MSSATPKWWLVMLMSAMLTACNFLPTSAHAPVERREIRGGSPSKPAPGSEGYHIVARGDTLYSIAWRYREDYKRVADWNGITSPYVIYPGQIIRLTAPPRVTPAPVPVPDRSPSGSITRGNKPPDARVKTPGPQPSVANRQGVSWSWPTKGSVVRLNLPTSEKGLDITGTLGQDIRAAASGEIVYSGSGLLGYGKLIIIKHNETYLSAYAYNDRILIEEGMQVTTGQKIATMGIGNNNKPLLHFEIRKDGQPVDPRLYLPRDMPDS